MSDQGGIGNDQAGVLTAKDEWGGDSLEVHFTGERGATVSFQKEAMANFDGSSEVVSLEGIVATEGMGLGKGMWARLVIRPNLGEGDILLKVPKSWKSAIAVSYTGVNEKTGVLGTICKTVGPGGDSRPWQRGIRPHQSFRHRPHLRKVRTVNPKLERREVISSCISSGIGSLNALRGTGK